MKKATTNMASVVALTVLGASVSHAQATIPYLGHLERHGQPVEVLSELQFSYFVERTGGAPCSVEEMVVDPSGGAFSVELLPDSPCFEGAELYAEIGVRMPGDSTYATLAGRQALRSTPYARAAPAEEPFVAQSGIIFDPSDDPAGVFVLGNVAFEGTSQFGMVLRGQQNGQVSVDLAANNEDDAFHVRGPTVLGENPPFVYQTLFKVQANGQTTVRGDLQAESLGGSFINSNATSGCLRLGEVQICWGKYPVGGVWKTITFDQPFADAEYALTCTTNAGLNQNIERFCTTQSLTAQDFEVVSFTAAGSISDRPGSYMAIGRWQ